ncbi:hypothetical protein pb186bvf_021084 [Paramecium bursaria]
MQVQTTLSAKKQQNQRIFTNEFSISGKVERPFKSQEQKFQQPIYIDYFENMKSMDNQRRARIQGIQIPFINDFEDIKSSDCFQELQSQDDRTLVSAHYPVQNLVLQNQFIRRVRGDGNCMYSSVIFNYIEILMMKQNLKALIDDLQNKNIIQDIYWNKLVILNKAIAKQRLIQILEYLDIVSKEQYEKSHLFSNLLQEIFNNIKGAYDIFIILIRSYALVSLEENYQNQQYKDYLDYNQYKEQIQKFEEEGDYIVLSLITEIIPISIKLIQFEQKKAFQNQQTIQNKVNKQKILGSVQIVIRRN